MKILSKILKAWKNFAYKIAKAQTWLMMFIIYFLIVPIFNVKRVGDPLKLGWNKKTNSYWETKKKSDVSLEGMRLPY
jgi:hypothetical protein